MKNLFLSASLLSAYLRLHPPLSHTGLKVELECVCVCVCVCVCLCVCLCMHVCYNLSPTVTKWCDRLCHMLDKWWMGARQHTIKPVNLLGNVTSHLLPDVWPLNARTNKATGRNTHTHTHTHTHKPALTPHHPHLFFLACRPPHAGLVD